MNMWMLWVILYGHVTPEPVGYMINQRTCRTTAAMMGEHPDNAKHLFGCTMITQV